MTDDFDVFEQYREFLVQRCRRDLLEESKTDAPRILDRVGLDTLKQAYQYSDCPAWQRYVIDLDGIVAPEAFSHENPLYRHTPRIFKTGSIFGIEKLRRTHDFADEYREAVQQAVAFAAQQGITIAYPKLNPAESIFLIQERDQLKVRFAFFRLRTEGGRQYG